jgi:hypothetical protein
VITFQSLTKRLYVYQDENRIRSDFMGRFCETDSVAAKVIDSEVATEENVT